MKATLEERIDEIISTLFPNQELDKKLEEQDHTVFVYHKLIRELVEKEEYKQLYDFVLYSHCKKSLFYDINHSFNDTLNNLKQSTIELLNILNS